MSSDFITRLEQFEVNQVQLSSSEQAWYNDFVHSMEATGEIALKRELDGYYREYQERSGRKVVKIWSMVGIAAMLVMGGFYLATMNTSSDPVPLQMKEAPIFSDSASYDTVQQKIEKKVESDVDKSSQ